MSGGHGGARPNSGKQPTPIDIPRARSLRQQGKSYADIGRRFGVSAWIIRNALGQIQPKERKDRASAHSPDHVLR